MEKTADKRGKPGKKQGRASNARPRGPVVAIAHSLERVAAIEALLIRPLAVLPHAVGEAIKPLKVGARAEIMALAKEGVPQSALSRALSGYLRSQRYLLALAQPDALRHDIDGVAAEPVSEADRMSAKEEWAAVRTRLRRRARQGEGPEAPAPREPMAEAAA